MMATLRSLSGLLFSVSLTLLGLIAVTFFIGRVVPIDPVLAVVGDRAGAEVVERVRVEMGLHLPLYQRPSSTASAQASLFRTSGLSIS